MRNISSKPVRAAGQLILKKKCSRCGVEQLTWPSVSKCILCGGPLQAPAKNMAPGRFMKRKLALGTNWRWRRAVNLDRFE
jgi:hypothetical protein